MNRAVLWLSTGAALVLAANALAADAAPELTVAQILDRHAAARGGLEAWHKIQVMAWTGHIESGPGGIVKRPFLMMFRRPEATHFEVVVEGKRSARVFDGTQGWTLRPTSEGLAEIKEYSKEEVSFAHDAGGLDGPLMDAKAKGISISLLGLDSVEGHSAYHLRVTLPSGRSHDDWVDAQSFLELRYDRETHNAAGLRGSVAVYLRNYQTVEGLVIPTLIETGDPAKGDTDKMIIEKIALNPTVEDGQFSKPMAPTRHNRRVIIDTSRPPGTAPPGQ
jgi:hypothetical protein